MAEALRNSERKREFRWNAGRRLPSAFFH